MMRLSLLLLLILLFSSLHTPILTVDSPSQSPDINGYDFIHSSCHVTLYPDLCFTTFSSFANTINNDSNRLANIAISLTLSKTLQLVSYLQNTYINYVDDQDHNSQLLTHRNLTIGAILKDCLENLGYAVNAMRGSLRQISDDVVSNGGSDKSFRFRISNVKTWLSAALTNEYTCTDGFEDLQLHEDNYYNNIKDDVCLRVDDVKMLTSISLALANRYADEAMP